MSDRLGWPELIGFRIIQRQQLADARPHAYPMTAPRVAASAGELEEAEERLGRPLDVQYREFLSYANGWPDFELDLALLGTNDLGQGPLWDKAEELLTLFYQERPVTRDFPAKDDLLPIGVGTETIDLYLVWTTGPETSLGRPVLWLAGEEVDRFPNFRQLFLGIYELGKRDLANATPTE
ncbi:MAG: SMI1/KNR4 family protein [Acidimicrobiales bacterium]|nr:SMI1/KNR4 family protein [Acidimicrobiales bacterium]MBO0893971.1 SMI1/KNR4 family protein [Acidimicrobiales bacterium]